MPKLYYRYGAMGSGKTVDLLVALYDYGRNGKSAVLIKPKVDVRHGTATVWTRVPGLSRDADIILCYETLLTPEEVCKCEKSDCVFVDESQFLHPRQVEQLSRLSLSVPVICYGLRSDFRGQLFRGSQALLTWADEIEEVKNVCKFCKHKSSYNLRQQPRPGEGAVGVELGADEAFVGVCKACFYAKSDDPALLQYKVHEYEPVVIKD